MNKKKEKKKTLGHFVGGVYFTFVLTSGQASTRPPFFVGGLGDIWVQRYKKTT